MKLFPCTFVQYNGKAKGVSMSMEALYYLQVTISVKTFLLHENSFTDFTYPKLHCTIECLTEL